MQTKRSKNLLVFLIFTGGLINLCLCLLLHFGQVRQNRNKVFAEAEQMVENLHSRFNIETAMKVEVNRFLSQAVDLNIDLIEPRFAQWKKQNFLPLNAADIIVFEKGRPLQVREDETELWQLFYRTVFRSSSRKFRLEGDDKNLLIKFLKGGVGYETIEGKPGVLRRINRGPEKTFAVWNKSSESDSDRVAILFIHEGRLPKNFLGKFLLHKFRSEKGQVAFVDLFQPENSVVPPRSFSPYDIATLASTFDIKNRKGVFTVAGSEVYLSAKPDGRILIFLPWEQHVSLPTWCLALPFFWIPLFWRFCAGERSLSWFSLRNLIIVVAATGILLPAILTGFYWQSFLETKMQSHKIEYARKLENYLVHIDAAHQQILRLNENRFRKFFQILDRKPQNLQAFIDESVRLEVNNYIDALILVDEKGLFYRPYSSCLGTVRGLVFYPREFRERIIKEHFARGWVPFDLEVDYLLNTEKVDLTRHVGFSENQGQVIITSLGKMAGQDIITSYNNRHGFSSSAGGEKISAMVMGSFVESADENPGEVISQNLGDYVEFGFGEYKSRNYVDVIRDEEGRAIYCAILYGASLLSTHHYFDDLFAKNKRWPGAVKFLAISDLPLRMCFPWPDTWRRMENLFNSLQPPRNLLVDEILINGELHLRCAYVARKCADYILVAYVPMTKVQAEVNSLKQTLMGGSLLLILILIFVFYRLSQGILEPAHQLMKGVAALERKDHSHQVRLDTQDEWQLLGNTFNLALERIKELQVAHFVQTCILPSGDISAANSVFAGRTIPADDVGGDLYEAFSTHDGMTFVMGDVSGHSISAALVVNMADAAFSALVDSGLHLPHEIFAAMNSLMLEHLGRVKMLTCFGGFVDKNGLLTYSNAGQAYPFLIYEDRVEILKQVGYPLGAAKKKKFKFDTLQLPSKCRLLMFSDGIIEALNDKGQPYGYERLEALVAELGCEIDRNCFFEKVYTELRKFSGKVPWGDDATLVLLDHDRRAIVNEE